MGKVAVMRIAEWFGRIGKFFREVRAELRKVTWPGRKELVTSALVVIFVVIISTTSVSYTHLDVYKRQRLFFSVR